MQSQETVVADCEEGFVSYCFAIGDGQATCVPFWFLLAPGRRVAGDPGIHSVGDV